MAEHSNFSIDDGTEKEVLTKKGKYCVENIYCCMCGATFKYGLIISAGLKLEECRCPGCMHVETLRVKR